MPALYVLRTGIKYTPKLNMPMHEVYARTIEKKRFIQTRAEYTLIEMWKCEWDTIFKELPLDVRNSLKDGLSDPERSQLDPRHAFCGGRTNATRLFYEVDVNEKIQYVDFC